MPHLVYVGTGLVLRLACRALRRRAAGRVFSGRGRLGASTPGANPRVFSLFDFALAIARLVSLLGLAVSVLVVEWGLISATPPSRQQGSAHHQARGAACRCRSGDGPQQGCTCARTRHSRGW